MLPNWTPLILVILVVCGSARSQTSQERPGPESLFQGKLDGKLYRNEFFGFSVDIPSEGSVLNQAEIGVYSAAGKDMIRGIATRNQALIDQSLSKEIILFNYASKPVGSPDNSVVVMGVLKQPAGAVRSAVMAESLKLFNSLEGFRLLSSLPEEKVGGISFSRIDFTLEKNGVTLNQRLYVSVRRGYSLSIGLTYLSSAGQKRLEEFLKGMQFEAK